MYRYPEWLRRVAFGSAYRKDKVSKLKILFELDERLIEIKQSFHGAHVPRAYIEKEFPEYKSLIDHLEKINQMQGFPQYFLMGSTVEGSSTCRLLKDPGCIGEIDILWLSVKLTDEKCAKLGRLCGRPGWYWLETSISASVIAQKKFFTEGSLSFWDVYSEWASSEVGPSVANEFTFPQADGPRLMSADNVPSVQLDFWPSEAWEWVHRSRKWPQVPLVVDITQKPCFLVHKPFTLYDPDANEWYISFTLGEKVIARKRSEGMKMTYFFFKAIYYCSFKYTSEEKEFGSYLVKTTMMWACEEYPIHQWTPDNLDANIRILLEKLLGYIDKRVSASLLHPWVESFISSTRIPVHDDGWTLGPGSAPEWSDVVHSRKSS